MKTDEIRESYLDFFVSKGHRRCESDVLVPTWDPSVLFTPAGMNQFKDHFLGKVKLEFTRATSCQKCLRTGDIDNVGRTPYHHTFFEMLGNFSFGDYFKREAIEWAWEYLTSPKWLHVPPDRLSASVYLDDDEAAEIWARHIGLPPERIVRMGEEDNFWPAGAPTHGPDGVCGPCSEIFYRTDDGKEVEIWNLVFTQFNRVGDPPNNLRPLPSRNIDTGMGLERTASVMQGVETNFHIDTLLPIVEAAGEVCRTPYDPASDAGRRLRRITDHVRACTMAIHENVYPGPNKEKYVIRRLLRRAVLDGHQLGMRQPFLYELVPVVVEMMKRPYPELIGSTERIAGVIRQEEESTLATIESGLPRAERLLEQLQEAGKTTLDGQQAAHLYSTYGFPPELLESLATERRIAFDWEGFQQALRVEPDAAHVLFKEGPIEQLKKALQATEFLGYDTTEAEAQVQGLVKGDKLENTLAADPEHDVVVVLDRSPFYGEAGGQVGDVGVLENDSMRFEVRDTQREGSLILHYGRLVRGEIRTGDRVRAVVDASRREGIRRAHSATHILHFALQKNLGSHAQQQGSKVDDDWLRFDFTHLAAVDADQIDQIERDVLDRIEADEPIGARVMPLAEARKEGAMMLFGEKYPDPVRMIAMGDFSRELCGGTHLDRTSAVKAFEIIAEEGVSAGTRRVVAVTGPKAVQHREQTLQAARAAAEQLGCTPQELPQAVRALVERVRDLKKQLAGAPPRTEPLPRSWPGGSENGQAYTSVRAALRESARMLNVALFDVPERIASLRREMTSAEAQLAQRREAGSTSADGLLEQAEDVAGAKVVVADVPLAGANLMRQLIDQIRRKAAPSAVLLTSAEPSGKVVLVAGLSRDLVERGLSAGEWVKAVSPAVDGGGGGKADMAQAGGKSAEKIPQALQQARDWIRSHLAA